MRTIFGNVTHERELDLAGRLHFHLLGMHFVETGPQWSSDGKLECDYLHHIDIAFSGKRQIVHEGRPLDILPGRAYFFPANTPVERRSTERCQVLFMKFRCEWLHGMDPLLDWPDRAPRLLGPVDLAGWQAWLRAGRPVTANRLLHLHARIEIWMSEILPNLEVLVGRHLEMHGMFDAVFKQVEEKLGADLRVTSLARTYGTGLRAFSKAFASAIGTSPKEYINRRLNQEAITLLLNTNLKVKEVADKLRFTNEFYFSRFFRKLNGVAPSDYRQRCRNGG